MKPSVDAIGPADAMVDLVLIAGFDGVLPSGEHAWEIIRVDGIRGVPTTQLLNATAEITHEFLTHKLDFADRTHDRHESRDVSQDRLKTRLRLSRALLRAPPIFNVDTNSEPFANFAKFVHQRTTAEQKQAVFSVKAAEACFTFARRPRS